MKRVYVSADAVQCGWVESILLAAGIECLVRNRFLGGAIGELPLNEAWPEIWVIDEREQVAAERLIARALEPAAVHPDWLCADCGEMVEGQFRQCWKCGHLSDLALDAPA